MNVERMKDALKIVSDECMHTECNKCPLRNACWCYMDEGIGYYADDILDYREDKPNCPYCREDEEKPHQYRCSQTGDTCYLPHSENCPLEDAE